MAVLNMHIFNDNLADFGFAIGSLKSYNMHIFNMIHITVSLLMDKY